MADATVLTMRIDTCDLYGGTMCWPRRLVWRVGYLPAPSLLVRRSTGCSISVDELDNGTHKATNLSSNSSRLGVKGDIQIGGNFAAIYQIESEVNADTGITSNPSGNPQDSTKPTVLASRNTFGGLQSADYGTLRFGRFDTPVKLLGRTVDLFQDQIGDSRNLTRGANGSSTGTNTVARFDERPDNSIGYTSPDFLGFRADLQYSPNVDAGVAGTTISPPGITNSNRNRLVDATITFTRASVFLGVGYERIGYLSTANPADTGNSPSILRATGYYDVGPVRINALWQKVDGVSKTTSENEKVYGLGLSCRVADWLLKAQGYQLKADAANKNAGLLAFGTEYTPRRNVTLYLDYALVDNDSGRGLTPYKENRSDYLPVVANGVNPKAVSLGTIIAF